MSTKDTSTQEALFAAEAMPPRYKADGEQHTFTLEPIRGFPELRWAGKRPFRQIPYYPAQLREQYPGDLDDDLDRLYWGDNLQVLSHLLREYRGRFKLIYIDPPYDSKAEYKKTIKVRGTSASSDPGVFEEKQYTDIWTNDEYLQFMFERLIMLRELLHDSGSLFLHCDWHRSHHLRALCDEVFGPNNFVNEIVWRRKGGAALGSMNRLSAASDTILLYRKSDAFSLNAVYAPAPKSYVDKQFRHTDPDGRRYMATVMRSPSRRPNLMYPYKGYKMPPNGWSVPLETMRELDEAGYLHFPDSKSKQIYRKIYLDEYKGQAINNLWTDIPTLKGRNSEIVDYPTQKPEALLRRILELGSSKGDLVLDCFVGSGTTAAVAQKMGRRFVAADINSAAIQTTVGRLLATSTAERRAFSVSTVNNYDLFRNPLQARDLLIEALQLQPLQSNTVYDGEKDGRLVKIMPVNRIATRQDLNELITNFNYKLFEKRKQEAPNQPVERLLIVCMGHEPDLSAHLQEQVPYKLDVEVVDILRDRADLEFKRDSEARVRLVNGELVIEAFYPMALLQKLSVMKEDVGEWRELVDSVLVDFNYDGVVMQPAVVDVPGRGDIVSGRYPVPDDAGTIRVRITDVLSESWEGEVQDG